MQTPDLPQQEAETATPPRYSIWRATIRILLALSASLSVMAAVGVYFWLQNIGVFQLSDRDITALLQLNQIDNSLVFDREGKKIGEFYTDYYKFISIRDIPKGMIDAVVAVEDRKFWQHPGIDIKGIMRALASHLRREQIKQGASTITQQVVRNFLLNNERTLERKVREAALATILERRVSKERILEIYLNYMFLGNGAYGVGAAAERYFGRPLQNLSTHEFALIAGLFQSPSRYNPHKYPERAKKRQLKVLRDMVGAGQITKKQSVEWGQKELTYQETSYLNEKLAPYFVDYIREQAEQLLGKNVANKGLRIYTTLDSSLQSMAQASLQDASKLFSTVEKNLPANVGKAKPVLSLESAILVTDPNKGEILAMVGGRDYQKSQFNRTVSANRAAGSAFKPAVFSLALSRQWKWSDMLFVAPVNIDGYRPKNFSGSYLSESTLLHSFYKSINTSTLEVGKSLGLKDVLAHAKRLGIGSLLREEAGTLLGASEVTMLDLARMYGTFAAQGTLVQPIAIWRITDRKGHVIYEAQTVMERSSSVAAKDVNYLMVDGLRSVFRYGTAARFNEMASYAGGKTGTTNESRDNWFCGFTPNTVAIVWVGADQTKGFLGNETGSTLALPVWESFMKRSFRVRPPQSFTRPATVVEHSVHPRYGNLDPQGIQMQFLQGREPEQRNSDIKDLSQLQDYRNLFGQ